MNYGESVMVYWWQKNMGIEAIHVEFDAHESINLIVDSDNANKALIHLLLDCKKMILDFKKFKIRHVFA